MEVIDRTVDGRHTATEDLGHRGVRVHQAVRERVVALAAISTYRYDQQLFRRSLTMVDPRRKSRLTWRRHPRVPTRKAS